MSGEFLVFSKDGKDLHITAHHANGVTNKRFMHEEEKEAIRRTLGLPEKDGVFMSIPDRDYLKVMTTQEERDGWLEAWGGLTPTEKLVYATNHYRINSYREVAESLGFTDIEEIRIGICGSENVVITHRSEQFQGILKEVEAKMTIELIEKGIFPELDLPWKLRKRMVNIESAVMDSVIENLDEPSVNSAEWSEWYNKTQETFYNYLLSQ